MKTRKADRKAIRNALSLGFYLVAVGAIGARGEVDSPGWTSWLLLVVAACSLWAGTATLTGHMPKLRRR